MGERPREKHEGPQNGLCNNSWTTVLNIRIVFGVLSSQKMNDNRLPLQHRWDSRDKVFFVFQDTDWLQFLSESQKRSFKSRILSPQPSPLGRATVVSHSAIESSSFVSVFQLNLLPQLVCLWVKAPLSHLLRSFPVLPRHMS